MLYLLKKHEIENISRYHKISNRIFNVFYFFHIHVPNYWENDKNICILRVASQCFHVVYANRAFPHMRSWRNTLLRGTIMSVAFVVRHLT